MKITKRVFFLTMISFFVSTNFVYSYIDPGMGSMLIQLLIASFVGALYCVKVFWKQIKIFTVSVFRKKGS
ncbi:hypothetical protein KAT08_01835 [Candidatus Babeliales bacterium]|nr:hypothetical protein [Candidatus Babeliales bacterium]